MSPREKFEQYTEPELLGTVENKYGLRSRVIYRYDKVNKAHVFQFEDLYPEFVYTWFKGVHGEPEEKDDVFRKVLQKYSLELLQNSEK